MHRLKEEEADCIAFAKLYFYLFEQLFIAIPINCIFRADFEEPLIKKLTQKESFDWFKADFRKEIVNTINLQYNLCFSKDDFLKILKDFLSKQYDDIIYSLRFIIDAAVDKSDAISIVEKECRAGKVIIEYFGDLEDLRDRADISNNHSHRSCCRAGCLAVTTVTIAIFGIAIAFHIVRVIILTTVIIVIIKIPSAQYFHLPKT